MVDQAYRQLYQHLRSEILGGRYQVGEKLPPERLVCERFAISRITVRHALRLLADDGLIERRQGIGSMVRARRSQKLPILSGDFSGSIRRAAPGMLRRLLAWQLTEPDDDLAAILGLIKGQQCRLAVRQDVLNDEVVAYDEAYFMPTWSGTLDEELLLRMDFLEAWQEAEQLTFSHMTQSVEAAQAENEQAERLGVPPGAALLLELDVMYATGGQVAAVFKSYYRGDRVKLVSTSTCGV